MTTAQFLFLGTGGSMGTPVIGCHCHVCSSHSPFNKRLRPSALLTLGNKKLLIDAGPDFRLQALHHHIEHLDGILLTHSHYDHIGGIDELRVYFFKDHKALPCWLSKDTLKELQQRYYYLFAPVNEEKNTTARLDFNVLEGSRGSFESVGHKIHYLTYSQGGMNVTGFRIGDFAYISDIREYPESIFEDLRGIHTLVVSALRFTPSRVHFSIDEAIDFANKIRPQKTWLMHVTHDVDHEKASAYLPKHIQLAYDGLELPFNPHNWSGLC